MWLPYNVKRFSQIAFTATAGHIYNSYIMAFLGNTHKIYRHNFISLSPRLSRIKDNFINYK
jgi:hypothetical protein